MQPVGVRPSSDRTRALEKARIAFSRARGSERRTEVKKIQILQTAALALLLSQAMACSGTGSALDSSQSRSESNQSKTTLVASPTSLSFNYLEGGSVPAAQTLAINSSS